MARKLNNDTPPARHATDAAQPPTRGSSAKRRSHHAGLTWEKLIFKYVVARGMHAVLEEDAEPVAVIVPVGDYVDTRPSDSHSRGRAKVRDFMVDVDHLQPSTEATTQQ